MAPGDRLSLPRRCGQRSNTCASWPAEERENRQTEGGRQKRRKTKRESAEEEGKKNGVIALWMLGQNGVSPMFR